MINLLAHGVAAAVIAGSPSPQPPKRLLPVKFMQGTDAPAQGTGRQNPSYFNPQISLVTDFRANVTNDDPTADKRVFLKEAELGIAADVDPYLRGEVYIAIVDEGGTTEVEVEEAFGRYNNLGRGLSAKFGKIAAAIGRVQRNHVDQLNWLDFPFVIEDFFGEEGLRAGGASLSYLFPGDRFNEITLEGLDAEDHNLFTGSHSGTPTWVAHYRTFFDFNEDTSAQFGATYVNGPSGSDDRSQAYGLDVTYKWQPGQAGKSLTFEGEAYWGKPGAPGADTAFGGFAALTYQIIPRVFATAKYDYSEIPGTTDIRRAVSLGATLKVTEFHHWRAEWRRITSNFAAANNVLNIQFQMLIGAHPAHRY